MATGTESAGTAAKILETIRELPFWLLLGLAVALNLVVLVPALAREFPSEYRPWLILATVVFSVLTVLRGIALIVQAVKEYRLGLAQQKTLQFSFNAPHSFWSLAKQVDDSVLTQICARFLVKNKSSRSLGLISVRLIKPKIVGTFAHESVTIRAIDENIHSSTLASGHVIPAEMALPASIDMMIDGMPQRAPHLPLDVVLGIKDDDGYEHRVHVTLKGTQPAKKPEAAIPLEPVFSINDPIEKEVASVLQAELSRYEKSGRASGAFGSVHIVNDNRPILGFGQDSWSPNTPRNQAVYEHPERITLCSDNLDALLSLDAKLSDDASRSRFIESLFARLNRERGYLAVSYFIVCTLWKIGFLNRALQHVKATLPHDDRKSHGFSNTLYMINGLLRYRYPDFPPEALDDIERCVQGLDENAFRIPEKIAAIRALRLSQAS